MRWGLIVKYKSDLMMDNSPSELLLRLLSTCIPDVIGPLCCCSLCTCRTAALAVGFVVWIGRKQAARLWNTATPAAP